MTHAEVYRELDRDRDTATTWWRHHLDTLRRPVLKARQLPLIHWADYPSPIAPSNPHPRIVGNADKATP